MKHNFLTLQLRSVLALGLLAILLAACGPVDLNAPMPTFETGVDPNTFVGFDPAQNRFTSITPIPSGGGSVRHMHYHKATDTVWFGTDEDTIGRAFVGQ